MYNNTENSDKMFIPKRTV